jgi:hypothetical protein
VNAWGPVGLRLGRFFAYGMAGGSMASTSVSTSSHARPSLADNPITHAEQVKEANDKNTRRTHPETTALGHQPIVRLDEHTDTGAVHERHTREIHNDAPAERLERCSQAVSRA